MKTILLTGAAGSVGTFLRKELQGRYRLRLSDIVALDDCGPDETFVKADLGDFLALRSAVAGVDGIIHLGGFSVEGDWPTILGANIIGTYNLFEAARVEGVKRIVFASSNHAMGFYRRDETVDHGRYPRPDSRYGLSKVFGESLGSLYADKYGAGVMNIRIGNVAEEPADVRRLSIWISPRDLAQLVSIGLEHPGIRFEVVYGMSDNKRAWWDNANARRLGYAPRDRSEDYAAKVLAEHSADTGDPLADAHQGGTFVSTESGGDPLKPHLA
ncbi:MAG: NAD-dependent epimerase/dehydratase family protein [Alphaproteobacteria bacterium]